MENGTTATMAIWLRNNSNDANPSSSPSSSAASAADHPRESDDEQQRECGTIVLANVGDSRAVLCRDGNVLLASVDHDLTDTSERTRCESQGARVVEVGGCMRLVPPDDEPALTQVKGARRLTLNMSRALGHRILSGYGVSAQPQLYIRSVRPGDRLVIASDGLWDVISNELAAFILSYQPSPADAVSALFNEAMDSYALDAAAADNISILVIFF